MTDLTGRTALITGAGNGLGAAISRSLHQAGARVILVGRTKATLDDVAATFDSTARVAICDVAEADQVQRLRAELADEHISILINNAGIGGPVAPLTDIDVAEWDEVFAANVRGVFLMCKAFLPPMVMRRDGDVINIASVSGKRPLIRRTPYCASKMAVIGLTSTLAFEVSPSGVRVNALSPGPVDGPRMERNFRLEAERSGRTVEQAEQEFVSRAAMGRMITEQEVGDAVTAMLGITGMTGADVDLSAGMVA